MIDLIRRHAAEYSKHNTIDRLDQVGLTPSSYKRLCEGLHKKIVRESAIPEGDVEAALRFFIDHPDVGAGKARVSLIDQETACLSTATLNAVKQQLSNEVAQEYKQRKEEEKLLEAQLQKDLLARQNNAGYQHLRAEFPNHIWATDFSNIKFLGMHFVLCVVYDEYSQNYVSLRAGSTADHNLAAASLREALDRTPEPPDYVRRDNGKPFLTEAFQRQLETTQDYPTPPHSPWYNGSLESCNTSLKAAIKTTGMQDMAGNPSPYREARKDTCVALSFLQDLVERVRVMLNEEISRTKHQMPPAKAFSGRQQATRDRHRAFVVRKKTERHERMANIRTNPKGRTAPRTLLDKARSIARRIIGSMKVSDLYVLNEVLHHRFRMFEI